MPDCLVGRLGAAGGGGGPARSKRRPCARSRHPVRRRGCRHQKPTGHPGCCAGAAGQCAELCRSDHRVSTAMAMATSPHCAGRLRERSLGPIRCSYRAIAVSAWFLLPYLVAFCHSMRPRLGHEPDVAITQALDAAVALVRAWHRRRPGRDDDVLQWMALPCSRRVSGLAISRVVRHRQRQPEQAPARCGRTPRPGAGQCNLCLLPLE